MLCFKVGRFPDGSITWWSSHVRREPNVAKWRYATKEENKLMRLVIEGKWDSAINARLKSLTEKGFDE